VRLIIYDKESSNKSIKDIKEQEVYMGEIPLMTDNGTFIDQRYRARHRFPAAPFARCLLRPRQGQDALLGQAALQRTRHSLPRFLAGLRVRPQGYRFARIDRRRKLPPPYLLRALGYGSEEILEMFFDFNTFQLGDEGTPPP
jgi:DNA-directed RNA polymerase subunit beta